MITQQLSGSGRGRGVVYSCRAIDGATETSYTVAEADVGKRLRMLLTVRNEDGWAWALTSSTADVTPAPAEPAPQPAPESAPGPAPSPTPAAPGPAGPAGTRLVIGVTEPGRIGKRTTIVIRRGKAPRRIDHCLMPGARKAVRCRGA